MKVIPCPKCRSIRTGVAPAGAGWMHCEKCSHTWMHSSEVEIPGGASAADDQPAVAPPARAAPEKPIAPPAPEQAGGASASAAGDQPAVAPPARAAPEKPIAPPAPEEAGDAPPATPAASAAPSPASDDDALPDLPASAAGSAGKSSSGADAAAGEDPTPGADYLPETEAKARDLAALTNRHEQPQVLETSEFTPTSSPDIDSQGGAPLERSGANRILSGPAGAKPRRPTTPPAASMPAKPEDAGDGNAKRASGGPKPIPPPPRPSAGGRSEREGSTELDDLSSDPAVPSEPRPVQAAAPGGSKVAFDLFDAIEKEIEHEREQLKTEAQTGGGTQSLSCPVCSHRFNALIEQDSVVCPKCGADVTQTARYEREREEGMGDKDPLVGLVIRGCEIDRKIGEGGMGSVYHARQLSLDRSVAIKVLPPELKRDKKFLTRFEQEAKSLARINHPNIMHVYDFGEDDAAGIYFMVMEFVDGLDLAEILRQKRRLPPLEVMDLMRQSALGLSQAAEKGVVHRDIKPDNLMVTADGVWKVSDFGLAKHVDALTQVTRAGIRVGTPAFMSPEQCDGKPLDFRSDIYSLGVTAYVSLTGRLPFDGESPFAIMLKHKTQHPAPLAKYLPDLSPAVGDLVMGMLAKDPNERAASWEVLLDRIEQVITSLSGSPLRTRSGGYAVRGGTPDESVVRIGGSDEDGGLPPIPGDLVGGGSGLSPAEVVERDGAVTTSRRSHPSSGPGEAQIAKPAGQVLPDAGAVGQMMDSISGEPAASESASPPSSAPATPPLDLAPLPDVPQGQQRSNQPPVAPGTEPTAARAPDRRRSSDVQRGPDPRVSSARTSRPTTERRSPTTSRRKHGDSQESRRSKHAQQASERHRQRLREVQDLEREGDTLLASGKSRPALKRFDRALQLCQELDRKATLVFKLEQARLALRRRRRKQVLLAIPVVLALLAVAWWQAMPRIHRELAASQFATVDSASAVDLEAFIGRHQRWLGYYTAVFPEYDLPALDRATKALELLREQARQAHTTRQVRTEVDLLREQLEDEGVPWITVFQRARELLPEADPTDHDTLIAIRDQAKAEVDRLAAAAQAVERQIAGGEIEAAVAAAAELARDPRLSAPVRQALPRALALEVVDRHGRPQPGARILVEGVPVEGGQIYRRGDRPVRLEVTQPGYIRHLAPIPPEASMEPAAEPLRVELVRGRAWEVACDVHGETGATALRVDDRQRLWVHGEGGTVLARLSDGTRLGAVRPPPDPRARVPAWMPWIDVSPQRSVVASVGGAVYALQASDGGLSARELLRLEQPVQAYLPFEASFRDGVTMRAALVTTADGSALVGIQGEKEDWRIGSLKVGDRPLLLHRQARLLVVGTQVLYAVEEDGRPTGTLTYPEARLGAAVTIGKDHLLVPTHSAVYALAIDHAGDQMRLIEEAVPLVSPPVVGLEGDGERAVLVTGDGRVIQIGIAEGIPQALWETRVGGRFGRATAVSITPDGVTVVGDGAQVAVFDPVEGALLQMVDHDGPVLSATTTADRVLVYGTDGKLVAYKFVTP